MSNFKKAIRTTLLVALVFVLFVVGTMELFFRSENTLYQDSRERDAISGTVDYMILGTSHAKWGVNPQDVDTVLGVNSYNYSTMWASYKIRYGVLEKELARNPVDTVVLEVSTDALRTTHVDGVCYELAEMRTIPERIQFLLQEMEPAFVNKVYNFCFSKGMESLRWIFRGEFHLTNQSPDFYKGYNRKDCMDVTTDYADTFNTQRISCTVNGEEASYLQKMVDLCKEKDVNIVLVMLPVSRAEICRTSNLDDFREWYGSFAEQNGLTYLDFNLLKERDALFFDQTSFINESHISGDSEIGFSQVFAEVMDRLRKGEDVSGDFYASYEDYERTQMYMMGQEYVFRGELPGTDLAKKICDFSYKRDHSDGMQRMVP